MIKKITVFSFFFIHCLSSCNREGLEKKIQTNYDEFWIYIKDTITPSEGYIYGYKFESNRYAYYIISPTNRVYNRYNPHAEGKYYITKDSIIQYYYPNCKISILNDTILEIIHNKGNIHKFKKIKYVDFKELEYVMW